MNAIGFEKTEHEVILNPVPTSWHHAQAPGNEMRGFYPVSGHTHHPARETAPLPSPDEVGQGRGRPMRGLLQEGGKRRGIEAAFG